METLSEGLKALDPQLGGEALRLARENSNGDPEPVLTALLNAAAELTSPRIMIIDDYHLAATDENDAALNLICTYLPPKLRLIISSRVDPGIALSRLRAQGRLTEIREEELRFNSKEAAEFLAEQMPRNITPDLTGELLKHADGWPAALQLAMIALRDGGVEAGVSFRRFQIEFLIDEVLNAQPSKLREFLLISSLPERFTISLCDALSEQFESAVILEEISRRNLFLLPLDQEGLWFRYHHLFQEALRERLQLTLPERIAPLHANASRWYRRQGLWKEALFHARAAQDNDLSLELLTESWPHIDGLLDWRQWRDFAEQMPAKMLRSQSGIVLGYVWALLNTGELEAAGYLLQDLPFKSLSQDELISATVARTYLSQARGEYRITLQYAEELLELLPDEEFTQKGRALTLIGLAHWTEGCVGNARESFESFMTLMTTARDLPSAVSATFVLSELLREEGRLNDAWQLLRTTLKKLADEFAGKEYPLGTDDIYREEAEILIEQNRLDEAKVILEQITLSPNSLPGWDERRLLTLSRLAAARRDYDTAIELAEEASLKKIRTPLPTPRSTNAWIARLHMLKGDFAPIRRWVSDEKHSSENNYWSATYARMQALLAGKHTTPQEREDLLSLILGLKEAASGTGRVRDYLDYLITECLAYLAWNETSAAQDVMYKALEIAEGDKIIRPFAEGLPALEGILKSLIREGSYRDLLLKDSGFIDKGKGGGLIEPLSQRETEVLQLLDSDLSGPEMARNLYISLNTLRTHTKNIYAKLGAQSRRTAVSRAKALDIL
jgi:LuxR family maltose regulon positive regulatory protein